MVEMIELKITQIDVYQVDLPFSGGIYHLSGGRSYTTFDATIVRITTNAGIEGWGESTPFGANYIAAHALGVRAGIAEMASHLINLDPRQLDRINETMDLLLVGHGHAKTAIDVACWDVFEKWVRILLAEHPFNLQKRYLSRCDGRLSGGCSNPSTRTYR